MPMIDAFVRELDHEAATTRRVLERVPEDRLDFKPHERSMTLGRLAGHVAELPGWGGAVLGGDFDMAPPGEPPRQPLVARDRASLLAAFDDGVARFRKAAAGVADERLWEPWRLLRGGEVVFELPRAVALRSFVFSHGVHHRGQLAVYLRLLDVPVPSIYGPSADEQPPG